MACFITPYIRIWNASLYDISSRKWIYGQLNLSTNAICFNSGDGECKNLDENSHNLYIDFTNIISINKALSSLVFTAITILTKDGNTFWFSSFQNRNSTFLILQHFYQAYLHQKPLNSVSTAAFGTVQKRTKFGTDLLHNVHDSQATLQKAAVNLLEQGDKLRSAAFTMEEFHEDLNVVERITNGLDSWMGRWALPPTHKAEELIVVSRNDIPDVLDLEVLYTQMTATKIGAQMEGVLRVTKEGMSVLDMKQKIVQYFKWSDLSRIRVVSPWEIIITRFLIGQPDLSYGILSTTMPKMLRKLEVFAARKMEYMNPPERHQERHFNPLSERGINIPGQIFTHTDSSDETTPVFGQPDDRNVAQAQQLAQEELITDSEVSELSAALCDLKNLALDIQTEQDSELKTIDKLTESVTRGSDRLKAVNSKIKKLAK